MKTPPKSKRTASIGRWSEVGHEALSPVSSKASKAASSRIGTPSSSALVSLAAPGPSPTTTAVVFFDTLPGDLPPVRLDRLFGAVAAEALERAGDDDRLAGERLRDVGASGPSKFDAGLAQLLDDAAIRRSANHAWTDAGDDRADAVDAATLVDGRVHDARRDAPKARASASAPARTEVADVQADQEVGERPRLRAPRSRRAGWRSTCRRSPRARRCGRSRGSRRRRRRAPGRAHGTEPNRAFAEAFDVHRAAGGEVVDGSQPHGPGTAG